MSYATVEFHTDLTGSAGAAISTDNLYRYQLWRRWSPEQPFMTFIMLNPSTADHTADDPTIRRCIGFAKREGCGGITVVNLYAFRATKPDLLLEADDPIGPMNKHFVDEAITQADDAPVVAAWGGWWRKRSRRVGGPGFVRLAPESFGRRELMCLGTNADGSPKHPLYVPRDAPLVPWPAR